MREILFRGKRTDYIGETTDEWVYGGYIEDTLECGTKYHAIFVGNNLCNSIDPPTLGQFTGLLDKNGTKIFEGDILSYNKKPATVVFDESEFSLDFQDKRCVQHGLLTTTPFSPIEVIGNIHDNPELMEGK